jgi:photosystem II stability/assembly factor-like uncharacterized protein
MTDLHVVSGTNSGLFHGTVQSFDGSEWTSEQLTNYALYDIWGTSGNNIWVVGESGTVFHYNGSSWVDASIPDDILKNGQLNAVWTTSPFPVHVAADGGDTYIRTGNVWKHERTFPNTAHRIVYGVDGNNVLMGGQGTIFRRN